MLKELHEMTTRIGKSLSKRARFHSREAHPKVEPQREGDDVTLFQPETSKGNAPNNVDGKIDILLEVSP